MGLRIGWVRAQVRQGRAICGGSILPADMDGAVPLSGLCKTGRRASCLARPYHAAATLPGAQRFTVRGKWVRRIPLALQIPALLNIMTAHRTHKRSPSRVP